MVDQPQYDWQREDFRPFEIGDVFSRAFGALKDRFVPIFLGSLLLVGVPQLLIGLWPLTFSAMGGNDVGALFWTSVVGGALLMILGYVLLPAVLIHICLKSFNGERASFGRSLQVGLSRFWPLLGAGILAGLGLILGFLLLIVPGIILYCGWYVFVAAIVMEQKGPTEALSRSWDLTSGKKGQVFTVILIATVIGWIVSALAAAPSLGQIGQFDPATGAFPRNYVIWNAMGSALGGAVVSAITAAFTASTYFELRKVKEGIGLESIASIFD